MVLEMPVGFEPTHKSFADSRLSLLSTASSCLLYYKSASRFAKLGSMEKARTILIVFLLLVVLVGLIFFALGYFKPQGSAISVGSTPTATVYLNGESVGKTPYSANINPGEISLRLVPDGQGNLLDYETKINLNPGVKTIVRRTFAGTEAAASGEIISFEKVSDADASLSVISDPDAAQIMVDGIVKGFTPLKISKIAPGEHQLIIAAPGRESKSFNIKTIDGYKLTVIAKLAESAQPTPTPTPTPDKTVTEVLIKDTETGFLTVRRDPTTASLNIGRVTPGLKYELVNTDTKTGWYQIKFNGEQIGWISNRYAAIQNPNNQANP